MSDKEIKKTPLLRFRAYEEAWRKYKLGDILTVKSGKDYKHLDKGEIPVYGTGGYMLSVNDKLSTVDAVGIGRKGTIDKPQLLNAPFWTVDTLFYMLPKRHFNLYYVYALASKINWKLYDESTGVPSLSKENIEKIVEMFPESNEQIKIGILFKQIDEIIRLYQRELELLQLEKQMLISKMFPKDRETVPEIRFKGYTDMWEQRKFSDCYKMNSGYAFKTSDYCENGVGLINGEAIQHGEINDSNLNFLPVDFLEEYSSFKLYEGDIVVGLNRPIINGNLKIARIPIKYNDSLLYQRAGKISYKVKCDNDFTYTLLSQEILKYTFKEAVGSDQPFISTSKLDKWKMMMPKEYREQEKIGQYFLGFDNLITLHQHKLEAIKKMKKTLLKYMLI